MTRPPLSGAALALLAGIAAPALAQEAYPDAPFRAHPALLAQAAALERIAVTAEAYARPAPEAESDAAASDAAAAGEEEAEEGLGQAAAPLFMASLVAKAPDTAEALGTALDALLEAREAGGDTAAAAGKVADLTARAKAALLPAEVVDTAPFRGALLAALLLDEGGVAESYEEASGGEVDAYAVGWTALRRARSLWDGLKARGAPEAVAEGDAALARLDALFPSAERPARPPRSARRADARADLYPGRDLGAAGASDAAVGRELLAIASAYHGALLAAPLSVMAPEAEARITAAFGAAGEAPDCGALPDALGAAREALGS